MNTVWIVIFNTLAGMRTESFEFDFQAEAFAKRVHGRVVKMVRQEDGSWKAVDEGAY